MTSLASHLQPLNGSNHDPDEAYMQLALQLAQKGEQQGEVPVGAVLVINHQVVASAHNHSIGLQDPSAHAEILCLRQASCKLGNYRLPNSTLYVTLEPCMMCAGALVHARIQRLVYGAHDAKSGVINSQLQLLNAACINHRIEYQAGVLEASCSTLLKNFFKQRRRKK